MDEEVLRLLRESVSVGVVVLAEQSAVVEGRSDITVAVEVEVHAEAHPMTRQQIATRILAVGKEKAIAMVRPM